MTEENSAKPLSQKQMTERIKITLENDNPIPEELPSEFTIVRFWKSEYNKDRMYNTQYIFCCGRSGRVTEESSSPAEDVEEAPTGDGESKGHVSMELILDRQRGTKSKGTYLSYGPKQDYPENSLETHEAKYIGNYGADLDYMERKPNYTIILYSLHVLKMQEALLELMHVEKQKWTLTGPRCNMGNPNDSFVRKTYKRIRFCWWATFHVAAILDRFKLQRIIVDTESDDALIDPTAEITPDENGEITMSCVSSVFYILHKGRFTDLLPRKDQRRAIAGEVSAVSSESVVNILQVNLEKVLRNYGYIFHLEISSVVINPDAFLCIIKYAKNKELLKIKNLISCQHEILFKNDGVSLKTPPEEEITQVDHAPIRPTAGCYKQTVSQLEWLPKKRSRGRSRNNET